MNENAPWSRLKGFYELDPLLRRKALLSLPLGLKDEDFIGLDESLTLNTADTMSENVIGVMSLPFSVAVNFVVNDKPVLVPMVTEEPSIVAAVSKMAKLVSSSGGFNSKVSESLVKGQLQLYGFIDGDRLVNTLNEQKFKLIEFLNQGCKNMVARGGGVINIEIRPISSKIGPMIIVEPLVDVKDVMGANVVNTLMEMLANKLKNLDAEVGIAILSNLCDSRLATATCQLPISLLGENGAQIAKRMLAAHAFAETDIYRACTHNKGILNGIDAVALATGNDFRAIEAGAHAFAAHKSPYKPLTSFVLEQEAIKAELTLPLAVGVVGGNCAIHKGVRFAHKILGPFSRSAKSLAEVMVSVGLAQCLAALLALSHEGIQKGHMKLHKKKLQPKS